MELEQRLRRVRPRGKSGIHREYHWVKPFYLEDLIAIYRAIDSTQDQAREEQARNLESWKQTQASIRETKQLTEEEYEEGPAPEIYTKPLIQMWNEEFEFDSLEQVAQLKRPYFQQFRFFALEGAFWVSMSAFLCYVSTDRDDPMFSQAVDEIDRVFRRRRSKVMAMLDRPRIFFSWVLIAFTPLILQLFPHPRWLFILTLFIVWAMNLWAIWGYAKLWPWRRVVVPQFQRDAEYPRDDRRIVVALTLLGLIIAILAWLFPIR